MPELPEVESLRRGLERLIVGQKIARVAVTKPKLVSGKGNIRAASETKRRAFVKGLTGAKFTRIDRRAKNLIFYLEKHEIPRLRSRSARDDSARTSLARQAHLATSILLVHLKMSGQFVYVEKGKNLVVGGHPIELAEHELPNKHTHIIFELEKGTLYYNDTRMFGYLLYYPSAVAFEKENHFVNLGVEPLDAAFTPDYLRKALKAKKGRLKTVLMDQKVVTGLGNIYADEAMFEAGVRPTRSAASLSAAEVNKLHAAIKRILKRAIELGGSSVATYRLIDRERGNYAREHKVYGKAGGRCSNCGGPLKKIVINSRTTVYCPKCQK